MRDQLLELRAAHQATISAGPSYAALSQDVIELKNHAAGLIECMSPLLEHLLIWMSHNQAHTVAISQSYSHSRTL
jgi:hypothetical protein